MGANGSNPVTVLLADDNPIYRAGIARAIEATEGLELVAEASDGEEALEAIRRHEPDVALLDLSMPGLDGIQVARAIRDGEPRVRTRAVLLTALFDRAVAELATRAGVVESLAKDSSRREICAVAVRVGRA